MTTRFLSVMCNELGSFQMVLPEKAQWLKNRLRTMGPAEIVSRLSDVGRHVALRASLKRVERRAQRQPVGSNYLSRVPACNGFLEGIDQQTQDRVVAVATRWLNHRASFFALDDVPLGEL